MPTLDVIMSPKEAKAGIVAMKFSYKGDYLAVSYNNESTETELFEETKGDITNVDSTMNTTKQR